MTIATTASAASTYEQECQRSIHLASGLRRIADVFANVTELTDGVSDLRDEAQHVEDGRFTIVVLGAFNRGKSTLLNAMVGRDGLPTAAIPSTAIISLLRFHPTEHATVQFNDGRRDGPLSLFEFKKKYVLPVVDITTLQHNSRASTDTVDDPEEDEVERERRLKAARDSFSDVDYSEIGIPCDLLRHGVELVDPPGFEDDDTRTQRAREFLDKSDAVIYLLDATQPVNETDIRTLDWITARGNRAIFFVINKWNFLQLMERTALGRQNVEQRIQSKLNKYLAGRGKDAFDRWAFKINALGALDARTSNPVDQKMLDDSNVPSFERALERFLLDERARARDAALIAKAERFCDGVVKIFDKMTTRRESDLDSLISLKESLEPKLEQLRGVRRHIEQFLDSRKIASQKLLEDSLNKHMRSLDVAEMVDGRIEGGKKIGGMNLDILNTWYAGQALKDLGTSVMERLNLWAEDPANRYPVKVHNALAPQIQKHLLQAFKKWSEEAQSITMRDEGRRLIDYLKEEAADYERILADIHKLLDDDDPGFIDVDDLVKQWLSVPIAGHRTAGDFAIDSSGLAIDLTPLVAAITAEIVLHLHGLIIPVVGSVISIGLTLWRQGRTEEKFKSAIEDGIKQTLAGIPTTDQCKLINREVVERYDVLKERVLTNINVHIATIGRNVDKAISDVQEGTLSIDAFRKELATLDNAGHAELDALKRLCAF